MCWLPLVNNFRNNLGGSSSWLDSRSQGARTGLDWVCSLVRVLLLALWKEFPGPALYPFMGPPGVNSDWFLVESLEKTLWETKKKKKKKKTLETFFFLFGRLAWMKNHYYYFFGRCRCIDGKDGGVKGSDGNLA